MKLVVDANILVSFFRDNPVRSIIINAKLFDLHLFSPEHAFEELKRNIPDITKYSKLSSKKVEFIVDKSLKEFIAVTPSEEFEQYNKQAEKLSPHKSNKDTPYFALALKLSCPIWSNESAFKQQSKVKVFNTEKLRKLLNI